MNLAPGTIFAWDYRIERPLGAGGMGALFVVEQMSTGQRRALKLMHSGLIANDDMRRKFEQEARVGARIESEHVVQVVASGVEANSGTPFLVMELLDGEDLAHLVERRGPLPPTEVAAIFDQLVHAVGAAHAAGIVHRDLKPENVFLARSRRAGVEFTVKVLDFGIAKLIAEGGGQSTAAMGSPMWLAPEQTERATITPTADVWALGLIAFYLLTGRPYWNAASGGEVTVAKLLREVLFEPIATASARAGERGRSLPPAFDAVFARSVTRNPTERFPDGRAFGAALASALRAEGTAPTMVAASAGWSAPPPNPYASNPYAPPPTPPPYVQTPPPYTRTSGGAGASIGIAIAGVALLLLAGGAAAAFFALRDPTPLPPPPATGPVVPVVSLPPTTPSIATPLVTSPSTAATPTTTAPATATTKPTATTTSTTPPPATGTLAAADVERVIRGASPKFRACYNKGLAEDPKLSGKLPIAIVVGPDGSVTSATIGSGATLASPTVRTCVLGVTRGLTFPAPSGGGSASVQFPLVFAAAE